MLRLIQSVVALLLLVKLSDTQKCSPWAVLSNCTKTCVCNPMMGFTEYSFSCSTGTLLVGLCLTRYENDSVVYGSCPYEIGINQKYGRYDFSTALSLHLQLEQLDEVICGSMNRQGVLCSQCKPGYGPAVHAYGFSCAKCNETLSGWALYLFLQFFPLTVFYAIVIIFHVKAASPPLISFVIFCQAYLQMERSSVFVRAVVRQYSNPVLFKTAQTLCGFWNFDFFRHVIPPFCVDSRLNNLHSLWLDFISAYYPLLLILITYIAIELHANNFKPIVLMWRPFHRCCVRVRRGLDPRASIVNAFATFLVLSISKILSLSFYSVFYIHRRLLSDKPTSVSSKVSFYQPEMSFEDFNKLYAIPVINVFLFAFLPVCFLCLYPTRIFRKVLRCVRLDQSRFILTFMDVFQGHLKDGTGGTRDYRAFAGLYIMLEVTTAFFLANRWNRMARLTPSHFLFPLMFSLASTLICMLQPYKKNWMNRITAITLTFAQCVIMLPYLVLPTMNNRESIPISILNVLLLLPHVVLYGYIVYKIANNLGVIKQLKKIGLALKKKLCFLRNPDNEQSESYENLPDRLLYPQFYQQIN